MLKFIILNKMKHIFILYPLVFLGVSCNGQEKFDEFLRKFPLRELPIDSVQLIVPRDTFDVRFFNYIVWESQPKEEREGKSRTIKPKVYKSEKLMDLGSFGKSNERPMKYKTLDGRSKVFYSKVYPVARVNINPNYYSLIVKEFSSEISHYDLYNFTKDGTRLSAVPLFTYTHDQLFVDSIDYVVTRSSISRDGSIVWFENNRGLRTRRIYKLREDGYFEIVKEERTGKFEY